MILNESNFQDNVINSTKPVVVDFWASWCAPCNAMTPAFDRLTEKLKDRFVFGKVNIVEESNLSDKYNIGSIPCFVFFKDGEVASTLLGIQSEAKIQEELEKLE